MELTTQIVLWVALGLLVVSAILAVLRVSLGPTILDRAVATDMVTSIGIALVAIVIVWWRREDLQALLILFAITGLFSSTTISRFLQQSSMGDADRPEVRDE